MFAERLKALRKEANLTQREFAQAVNVAVGTVGMWEIGKREPAFDTVNQIANFFEVSVDYLLGRTDQQKKPTPATDDERKAEFIQLYEQLSDEEKAFVIKQIKGLLTED